MFTVESMSVVGGRFGEGDSPQSGPVSVPVRLVSIQANPYDLNGTYHSSAPEALDAVNVQAGSELTTGGAVERRGDQGADVHRVMRARRQATRRDAQTPL